MAIDKYCGELETASKEWDPALVKELLCTSHLGDYVWIYHTGNLMKWRKKVTEWYVAVVDAVRVVLVNYNPLEYLMKPPHLFRYGVKAREIELDTILAYTLLPKPKND